MFTSPSPATVSTTNSTVTSPVPPRTGRLRGLSALRNYTHQTLHNNFSSSDLDHSHRGPVRPSAGRAATVSTPQIARPTSPQVTTHTVIEPQSAPTSASATAGRGWLPSSGGSHGSAQPTTQLHSASSQGQPLPLDNARMRVHETLLPLNGRDTDARLPPPQVEPAVDGSDASRPKPTIQFIPYNDNSSRSRPSLDFARVSRVLPRQESIIRVGRYSERDNQIRNAPSHPSDAPVGFKSKVVSRRHCEFWCEREQWYVKDVKSSSGTFLNHVRLSPPGVESRPYAVKDGDIVQLGIDFKGGEEMIFRCVKIRIECNRGWQKTVNKFNKSTHKQLRKLAGGAIDGKDDSSSRSSTECTICLNSIAPCQALFVAPCSHTWHFKCIRTLLESPPIHEFTCPNCRAQAYLDADVDEPEGYEESFELSDVEANQAAETKHSSTINREDSSTPLALSSRDDDFEDAPAVILSGRFSQFQEDDEDDELARALAGLDTMQAPAHHSNPRPRSPSGSAPMSIPERAAASQNGNVNTSSSRARTPSASAGDALHVDILSGDGPMTPRNNAGPFVFNGSATGSAAQRTRSDSQKDSMPNLSGLI